MRMPFWRELKWLIASYLISAAIGLVRKEATADTVLTLLHAATSMKPDPKFETVRLRSTH